MCKLNKIGQKPPNNERSSKYSRFENSLISKNFLAKLLKQTF